jgi:hypothetical protein
MVSNLTVIGYSLLALDRSAGFVPMHGLLAEVRLVGHVASERGMMTEECVFDDWTA